MNPLTSQGMADAFVDFVMHHKQSEMKTSPPPPAKIGDVNHNDPKYIRARRLTAGIISIATGACLASGNQEAMDMAMLTSQIINDHFDDYWAAAHPINPTPPVK